MTRTTPRTPRQPAQPDLHPIDITHAGGDAYVVKVRGHRLRVDQPMEERGANTGPTPSELFVASLAACVAFYAGRYLARHGVDRAGLRVRSEFSMADDRPARVSAIRVAISPPPGLPPERRAGLLAIASHCTVHNTLQDPPAVGIELE